LAHPEQAETVDDGRRHRDDSQPALHTTPTLARNAVPSAPQAALRLTHTCATPAWSCAASGRPPPAASPSWPWRTRPASWTCCSGSLTSPAGPMRRPAATPG